MKNTTKKMKVLDLFSGAGGMSTGFEMAGFEIAAGVDFNKWAIETFKFNHTNAKSYLGDISDPELLKIVRKEIGDVDVIIGGPPCQGFSLKGKKLGLDDPRNFLFQAYAKYVKVFKPKYFVMENVLNMIHSEKGYFKDQVVDIFTKMGYKVTVNILNANEHGVPQKRRRAIFIGSLDGTEIFIKPTAEREITIWDAISDLNYLNSGEEAHGGPYIKQPETSYQKLMRKGSKTVLNHTATNHSDSVIERMKMVPQGGGREYIPVELHTKSVFGNTWSRMRPDELSSTLTTRYDTPSSGKYTHPYKHRAITDREAARIQSFPDKFEFFGPRTEVMRQIGNAVPPLAAKGLAKAILNNEK